MFTHEQMREFVRKVREMREAQKEYFRSRSSVALDAAKQLEAYVDGMVKYFYQQQHLQAQQQQKQLL